MVKQLLICECSPTLLPNVLFPLKLSLLQSSFECWKEQNNKYFSEIRQKVKHFNITRGSKFTNAAALLSWPLIYKITVDIKSLTISY